VVTWLPFCAFAPFALFVLDFELGLCERVQWLVRTIFPHVDRARNNIILEIV
jgi:hypothetical protein